MNKKTIRILKIISVFYLLFLLGCTTDKPFVKKDAASLAPMKVVRFETPGIQRRTATENFLITTSVILPGGSAVFLLGDEYAKARGGDMQTRIPDFGYLVVDKFTKKINGSSKILPPLTIVEQPVKEEYNESCNLIEFKVKKIAYGYLGPMRGKGFMSDTLVTMKDPQGEVLWQKDYTYMSKDFNRDDKELDEYEADNAKLLKEECEFAAEKTVLDFINHLNGEKL